MITANHNNFAVEVIPPPSDGVYNVGGDTACCVDQIAEDEETCSASGLQNRQQALEISI